VSALHVVIMAGGRGERFWPMSTQERPKQFLSLVTGRPMLVEAVERVRGLVPPERILILTNARHRALARELVPEIPEGNVVGEPVGRDTGPAVALATGIIGRHGEDAVYCMLTADHVIGGVELFLKTLKACAEVAGREDALLTIGMRPREPSTGYGYIEAGEEMSPVSGIRFFRARRFVEKPDRTTAEKYLAQGNFFWNSGMFIWRVGVIREALRRHRPQLYEFSRQVTAASAVDRLLTKETYGALEKISIDYAVMEKAANVIMAEGVFEWDDIGSWSALAAHLRRDRAGNASSGRCVFYEAEGCVAVTDGKLAALVGVRDLVVVQAGGVILVCPRDRAQDVKKLVHHLEKSGGYEDVL